MTSCKPAIVALIVVLLTGQTKAESTLVPFNASYRVKISVLSGEMQMSLAAVENRFVAKLVIEPRGLTRLIAYGEIAEQAEFAIRDGVVVPLHYESVDTLSKDGQAMVIDFDYHTKIAKVITNTMGTELSLDRPTFDRVSIQYAMMLGLNRGTEAIGYAMLDGDEIKALAVNYEQGSSIRVPYGEFTVRKVQYSSENSSRVTTLWCARDLNFLPVRIEQHRKGKLMVRADLTDFSSN